MGECGRRRVFGGTNAEMLADSLTKLSVDGGDAGFAVELDEGVALGHDFKFTLDHGLVANERPIEIVRKRHVAAGFPIADGLGFLEFAGEGSFRANVEPKGEIGAKGHGVETGEIVSIDTANDAAGNQGENEAVGENDCAGTKSRNNAMFELVEKVGGVHQSESKAGDGIFGEEFVNVAANEVGTAKTAGLHGKAFGLQPFLEERDLRGTSGTVETFYDNEIALQFGGIEADEMFAKEKLGVFGLGMRLGRLLFRGGNDGGDLFFVFLVFRHDHSTTSGRGAKRLRSILEATISRICFWSLLTGRVPSRTTKLSLSTMRSYSSRMRAWKSLKLSERS